MRKVVEHLVFGVVEGAERQRLQVQQLRVRRVAFGEEEVLEAQRKHVFCGGRRVQVKISVNHHRNTDE